MVGMADSTFEVTKCSYRFSALVATIDAVFNQRHDKGWISAGNGFKTKWGKDGFPHEGLGYYEAFIYPNGWPKGAHVSVLAERTFQRFVSCRVVGLGAKLEEMIFEVIFDKLDRKLVFYNGECLSPSLSAEVYLEMEIPVQATA